MKVISRNQASAWFKNLSLSLKLTNAIKNVRLVAIAGSMRNVWLKDEIPWCHSISVKSIEICQF